MSRTIPYRCRCGRVVPVGEPLHRRQFTDGHEMICAACEARAMLAHDTPRPAEIPAHLWPGLRGYLLDRRPVGGFLTSLLEGELATAAARADSTSARALPDLVAWLEAHAPAESVGTPARVRAWLDGFDPAAHARR